MAEERTEKPTGKRREEARKRGQVAKTQELGHAVQLLGVMAILVLTGAAMWGNLERAMTDGLQFNDAPNITIPFIMGIGLHALRLIAAIVGPIMVAVLLAGILLNGVQTGLRITPGALQPNLKTLNPLTGLKRYGSIRMYVDFSRNFLKLLIVGGMAFMTVYGKWHDILMLSGAEPQQVLAFVGQLIVSVALKVALVMFLLGAADFYYQRWQMTRDLRMTKEEVKREVKDQEVSPHVRRRIRQAQQEASRRRMLEDVPTADVVITNPTHFACALAYDGERDNAPRLVAKGADLIAFTIREIATNNGVPLVEDRPLARALYSNVEIGSEIPDSLFAAVAEVLAYIYKIQKRKF